MKLARQLQARNSEAARKAPVADDDSSSDGVLADTTDDDSDSGSVAPTRRSKVQFSTSDARPTPFDTMEMFKKHPDPGGIDREKLELPYLGHKKQILSENRRAPLRPAAPISSSSEEDFTPPKPQYPTTHDFTPPKPQYPNLQASNSQYPPSQNASNLPDRPQLEREGSRRVLGGVHMLGGGSSNHSQQQQPSRPSARQSRSASSSETDTDSERESPGGHIGPIGRKDVPFTLDGIDSFDNFLKAVDKSVTSHMPRERRKRRSKHKDQAPVNLNAARHSTAEPHATNPLLSGSSRKVHTGINSVSTHQPTAQAAASAAAVAALEREEDARKKRMAMLQEEASIPRYSGGLARLRQVARGGAEEETAPMPTMPSAMPTMPNSAHAHSHTQHVNPRAVSPLTPLRHAAGRGEGSEVPSQRVTERAEELEELRREKNADMQADKEHRELVTKLKRERVRRKERQRKQQEELEALWKEEETASRELQRQALEIDALKKKIAGLHQTRAENAETLDALRREAKS